jgi:hypothetical protein
MSIAERLIGAYRVVAMEHYTDDGEIGRPYGDHPKGYIIYTAEGCMSALLMLPERPNFAAGDILAATEAERVAAFTTFSSFAGRYEIVGDQIIHHLDVTSYPNWTGTDQVRNFDLTDTHLTLYPPRMLMEGKIRRGRVHCERMQRP